MEEYPYPMQEFRVHYGAGFGMTSGLMALAVLGLAAYGFVQLVAPRR